MRCPLLVLVVALVAALMSGSLAMDAHADRSGGARPCVLRLEVTGVINAGTADYLESGLRAVEQEGCSALLVVIDTPGGTLDATRSMVRSFLRDAVPAVTYVSPSGARAGSAGMFITLAGNIAAMAPGSNMGAAHPVLGPGRDPDEAGEELARKIVSDAAALARAIAERRERDVEWAELAVRESASATADEALDLEVIDLIAPTERALLEQIHGREVRLAEETVALDTHAAVVRPVEMTIRQRALTALGDPNLAYLLLMAGLLGIVIEIYNPGLVVPGAAGAVLAVLGAIGLNTLPVNLGAFVLLALAVALFVAEVYVTSFGLLTAAGIIALLTGSALLIDRTDPDFFADAQVGLSWWAVVPMAVVLGAGAGLLAWLVVRTQRRRAMTGTGSLVGAKAVALTEISDSGGWVRVHGEQWRASSDETLPKGATVRVVDVEGLELKVRAEGAGGTGKAG